MKKGWNTVKRAAIYVIYDKDGIIESYVVQILKQMKSYVMDLIVVCNGSVTGAGYQILDKIADEVIRRDNIGYDAGAYKDAILQLHEQNRLREYDELILMNDSFLDFFYPLDDFFQEVYQNKAVDFWGFTKYSRGKDKQGVEYDEHIQTYFMLIKKDMLHSEIFLTYWQELPLKWKEYLKKLCDKPGMEVLEVGSRMVTGGYVFVETHYSFSSHERPWHFFQYSENALNVLFPEKFGMKCIKKGCSNLLEGRFSEAASDYLQGKIVPGLYCHSEFLGQKAKEVDDETLLWDNVVLEDVADSTKYPYKKEEK